MLRGETFRDSAAIREVRVVDCRCFHDAVSHFHLIHFLLEYVPPNVSAGLEMVAVEGSGSGTRHQAAHRGAAALLLPCVRTKGICSYMLTLLLSRFLSWCWFSVFASFVSSVFPLAVVSSWFLPEFLLPFLSVIADVFCVLLPQFLFCLSGTSLLVVSSTCLYLDPS